MSTVLAVLACVLAAPGTIAAIHLALLVGASLFYRDPSETTEPLPTRFLVLVPAHNEEAVLGATLEAVMTEMRPTDLVLVVADRCTDSTAELACDHGAEVLERGQDRPAGKAAALADGVAHATGRRWDACLILDADSVVAPGFLPACERMLATGASVLQARSEAELRRGLLPNASLAAFALQGVAIPRGRDRLGLSVRLRGTGMVLTRPVLERHPWAPAGASEDLRYTVGLCLDDIRPRHVDAARLRSVSAPSLRATSGQRVRWEAGRMLAARTHARSLLRHRTPSSIEAAVHLLTPPFALAFGSLGGGALVALVAGNALLAGGIAVPLCALAFSLVTAMVQARVPLQTWIALAAAPPYIVWKVWVQLVALSGLTRADQAWEPTARRQATPNRPAG